MLTELIRWERGELSEEATVEIFQRLINSGAAWKLPGRYGRTARRFIDLGLCLYGPRRVEDYFGKTIPSRFELSANQPGSVA